MTNKVSVDSIRYAMERIENFDEVQRSSDFTGKVDAVGVLLNSFGLDDDILFELTEWFNHYLSPMGYGPAIIGMLLVFFAQDYDEA